MKTNLDKITRVAQPRERHPDREVLLTYRGKTQNVQRWAKETGLRPTTIYYRVSRGLNDADCLSTALHRQPKSYTVDGVAKTMNEHCADRGLDRRTVEGRLRWGWDVQRAFTEAATPKKPVELTHEGKTGSLEWWLRRRRRLGLTAKLVRARLQKGWTVARALDTPRTEPAHNITHAGRTMTLTEWAVHTGVNPSTLRKRLDDGMSPDEAMVPPGPRPRPSPRVKDDGTPAAPLPPGVERRLVRVRNLEEKQWRNCVRRGGKWRTVIGLCRQHEIAEQTFMRRLHAGWELERALTAGSVTAKKAIHWRGEVHGMNEWASITKIPGKTIRARLKMGWSIDRALGTPVKYHREHCKTLVYQGERVLAKVLARRIGISAETLRMRLQRGMSVEEATSLPYQEQYARRKPAGADAQTSDGSQDGTVG